MIGKLRSRLLELRTYRVEIRSSRCNQPKVLECLESRADVSAEINNYYRLLEIADIVE